MKMPRLTWRLGASVGLTALCLVLVVAGITVVRHWLKREEGVPPAAAAGGPQLRAQHSVFLPPEIMQSLGIRTALARPASRPREIPPLAGSLALDPTRLARVNCRFPGEVMEIATTAEGVADFPGPAKSLLPSFGGFAGFCERPLRFGDKMDKGQLLAVVWSKELGEKKSELADALSQEHLERENLRRVEELLKQGAIAESRLYDVRRAVQASTIAVARAERTLEAWRLTKEEIKKIRAEAARLRTKPDAPFDPHWARVEIRAPQSGVILEKNLNIGDIVDPTINLFKIADLSRLAVWAHIYEEDLPALMNLPGPISWSVQLKADPSAPEIRGTIDTVGTLIDPTQHTGLLTGTIDNSEGKLRPGQFITARMQMPVTSDDVEIPSSALIEDGEESVVFVQPDAGRMEFELRPVCVTRREEHTVSVRSRLSEEERRGPAGPLLQPLRPGERVVVSGVLQLRQTLDNLVRNGK